MLPPYARSTCAAQNSHYRTCDIDVPVPSLQENAGGGAVISKADAVMAVGGIFVHSQKWVVVIASMPVHPLVSSVLMMLLARLLVRGVLPLGRKWLGGDLRLAMPVVVLMSGLGAVFLLLQSAINTWSFWLVVILQEMNAAFKNLPRLQWCARTRTVLAKIHFDDVPCAGLDMGLDNLPAIC